MHDTLPCFRKYIPWERVGLAWDEDFYLPLELIRFFNQRDDICDMDKVALLRAYSLLQFGDPDSDSDLSKLMDVLKNKQWLLCEDGEFHLRPLYQAIFPKLGKHGYDLFIEGRVYSYIFPRHILDILKAMPITDKKGEKKNKTSNFLLSFLYQLTINGGLKFVREEYYCGGQQLSASYDALLFAIAKTCYESEHSQNWDVHTTVPNFAVRVQDGKVIADILESSVQATLNGEGGALDEATHLFFLSKYGEENAKRVTDRTKQEWRRYWEKIVAECGLTADDLLFYLKKVFENNNVQYVPAPYSAPSAKNPIATTLSGLLLVEKNRVAARKSKANPNIKTMNLSDLLS